MAICVQAHRGASGYAPENTLPAFQKAIELGADGIETDIHYTRDGRFAVCHDNTLERTSDGQGSVSEKTIEQLKAYDFGCRFEPRPAEPVRLPVLEELLDLVREMDVINIEVKELPPEPILRREAVHTLLHILRDFACGSRVILSSFQHEWLREIKDRAPELRTGLLYGAQSKYSLDYTLAMAKEFRADYVHPYLYMMDAELVAGCRRQGIGCNVWTVDTPEAIDFAIALEPDGIISNYPDRVLRAIGR